MDATVTRKPVAPPQPEVHSDGGAGVGATGGGGAAAGNIKRKPVSRDSISLPAPKPPVTLRFSLGALGLHSWYNSSAPYVYRPPPPQPSRRRAGTTSTPPPPQPPRTTEKTRNRDSESPPPPYDAHGGPTSPQRSATFDDMIEYEARPWSGANDQRRWIIEESPLKHANTVQLYNSSPNHVTASIIIDEEGNQQHKVQPPHQPIIAKFGKMKREYERSLIAVEDLNGWITLCLINNMPPRDLQISFGPDESFYAQAPDGRVKSRGLPIDLQQLLDSRDKPPNQLSMGVGGTWWVQWQDGTHEQYIQQNSYPDLCILLENIEVPQLKRIQLNPAKANEFLVEYANGHFFLRARCQPRDLEQLNNYLKQQQSDVKIVVLGVLAKALDKDLVCEPFVLPIDDFEHAPIMTGKELDPGQLPEWMEYTKGGIEMAKTVAEIAQAAGACSLM